LRIEAERFDPAWLDGVDVLLVDGHLMELSIRAARHARSLGIPTVLDAGSWKPGMDGLLPEIDHAVCAERFRPPGCEDFEQVFDYLEHAGITHRAITRGPRPILYRGPDQRLEIEVPSIEAIDTLAAGDIFHGAYAHALAVDADATAALVSAAEVAGRSCTTFGPRAWMDRKTEEIPS
jgi:sugar/nucleoside kinase (ribokinase family)